MNWYEKIIFRLGHRIKNVGPRIKKLGNRIIDFALAMYAQRVIDQQLPKSEVKWGNFETKEGEHDHV